MKNGIIYKLTCGNNFLFGSTISKSNRFYNYKNLLSKNKYGNFFLQSVYNKYGEESLKFEIVQENIPEDILTIVEDIWIGANCSKAQDKKGGMNLKDAHRPKHSEESKKRMSDAQKGLRSGEKHHFYGKKRPNLNIGMNTWLKMTSEVAIQERRDKLSKRMKNKPLSKNQLKYRNSLKRPVIQMDLEGNFIREWECPFYARIDGFYDSHIRDCCKGIRKTHKKFKWKYKE